jgi:alpha-ketoglutarate-dependent taurine dioxygenase
MQGTAIEPFGLLVEASRLGEDLRAICGPALRAAAERRGLVLLRGFAPLSGEELVACAAAMGRVYTWEFGALLDLVAHEVPRNYLFSRGSVPFHWDGAFREEAPALQLFQCLRAPASGGGETEFCDTRRVLRAASPSQRARWEGLSITYRTDKVAHYGGTFTARLCSRHPRTGEATLRIGLPNDEHTSPENPVDVHVDGLPPEEGAAILAELREMLHQPELCLTHAWRDGDFLLADNHALVHGRRAFTAASPRHLQRVHLV